MTWIILDALALLVLLLFFFLGRRRGFVAMALLLVGALVSLWAAQQLAQPAAQWCYDSFARERLVRFVEDKLEDGEGGSDIALLADRMEGFSEDYDPARVLDRLKDKADGLLDELERFTASQNGQGAVIPFLDELDADPQQTEQLQELLSDGATLAEALVESLLKPVALSFLETLCFLVLFLLFMVVIRLLIALSGVLNRLPLLGGMNRFLGSLCGLAEGAVVLYLLGILLRMLAATAGPDSLITLPLLEETKLLSSIIFFLE